jgi:hypothetical protein
MSPNSPQGSLYRDTESFLSSLYVVGAGKLVKTPIKRLQSTPSPTGNKVYTVDLTFKGGYYAKQKSITVNGNKISIGYPSFKIEMVGKGKYLYTKEDGSVVSGNYQAVVDEGRKEFILKESAKVASQFDAFGNYAANSNLVSPQAQNLINKAKKKVDTIKEPLLKNDSKPQDKTSGRLAIIMGYDGIRLNKSYQPDNFATLFNRSKLTVQNDPLDNNNLAKEAAGKL